MSHSSEVAVSQALAVINENPKLFKIAAQLGEKINFDIKSVGDLALVLSLYLENRSHLDPNVAAIIETVAAPLLSDTELMYALQTFMLEDADKPRKGFSNLNTVKDKASRQRRSETMIKEGLTAGQNDEKIYKTYQQRQQVGTANNISWQATVERLRDEYAVETLRDLKTTLETPVTIETHGAGILTLLARGKDITTISQQLDLTWSQTLALVNELTAKPEPKSHPETLPALQEPRIIQVLRLVAENIDNVGISEGLGIPLAEVNDMVDTLVAHFAANDPTIYNKLDLVDKQAVKDAIRFKRLPDKLELSEVELEVMEKALKFYGEIAYGLTITELTNLLEKLYSKNKVDKVRIWAGITQKARLERFYTADVIKWVRENDPEVNETLAALEKVEKLITAKDWTIAFVMIDDLKSILPYKVYMGWINKITSALEQHLDQICSVKFNPETGTVEIYSEIPNQYSSLAIKGKRNGKSVSLKLDSLLGTNEHNSFRAQPGDECVVEFTLMKSGSLRGVKLRKEVPTAQDAVKEELFQ